jgi:hypothetical protein
MGSGKGESMVGAPIVDVEGTVFTVWCHGGQYFYYTIRRRIPLVPDPGGLELSFDPKYGRRTFPNLPYLEVTETFGECRFPRGVNFWVEGFGERGGTTADDFKKEPLKKIRWFNVGPIEGPENNKLEHRTTVYNVFAAVKRKKTVADSMEKDARDELSKLITIIAEDPSAKGKLSCIEYRWPERMVFRLQKDGTWKEDKSVPFIPEHVKVGFASRGVY